MSWKDLLYFSRSERYGTLILLVLIFIITVSPRVYKSLKKETISDFSEFEIAVNEFRKLNQNQSLLPQNKSGGINIIPDDSQNEITPFVFNPNELPEKGWEEMGLSPKIRISIMNYRRAGGVFRYKEDFARLYLVDEILYKKLEPYIQLPSYYHQNSYQDKKPDQPRHEEKQDKLMIDLNKSDTTELMKLKGIGPVFSKRIIKYREKLGGFYSVNQLLEVYGMDSTRFSGIADNIIVKDGPERININNATFEELNNHPYIDYNTARSIIAIRQTHGEFSEVDDLLVSHLIDNELLKKLHPYLTVEVCNNGELQEDNQE